jgi:hypothetical protein
LILVVGEAVEHFLFRLVADGASVGLHQIGLLDRVRLSIAFLQQRADGFLES